MNQLKQSFQPRLLLGCLAVAVLTIIGLRLNMNMASVAALDLLIVVLVALYSGFWQASILSLGAVASLDYYFIPPLFSLAVADPQSWVSLATFECTAVVVSRLSHAAKLQAWTAEQRRRDVERLYNVSTKILLPGVSRDQLAPQIPHLIRREFPQRGVALFDSSTGSVHSAGELPQDFESATRDAFLQGLDYFDDQRQISFQLVRIGGKPEGVLAMAGPQMTGLVAGALASLGALALESGRSFERETLAQAGRQTEQLRAAVLDALAHEFKTPLTTIRAASSGMLEMGRLASAQKELATLIDNEADHLTQLTTKLLRTAALESDSVKVRSRPASVREIIDSVVSSMRAQLLDRRILVRIEDRQNDVIADPDLCARALTQLLENARTYSYSGSDIELSAVFQASEVIIAVTNQGAPIAVTDQEHVFDRFYRAAPFEDRAAGRGSGTGIGLSVAKNLIEAQGGRIWVESNDTRGTTFYVALPSAPEPCARKA